MATIPPTSGTNQQLAGIRATVPMPTTNRLPANTLTSGANGFFDPVSNTMTIGGPREPAFTIDLPGMLAPVTGGGTTPAPGAQPAAPNATGNQSVTGTSSASGGVSANTATTPGHEQVTTQPTAAPTAAKIVSGFGGTNPNTPLRVSINGAAFSFPPDKVSTRASRGPDVRWGQGWSRVSLGNGQWYMKHANGTKAAPGLEWRMVAKPNNDIQTVKVGGGWARKFPDGTLLVFPRTEAPYRLNPDGTKVNLKPGVVSIDGRRVRILEVTVVRTIEPNGATRRFGSRGSYGDAVPRFELTGAAQGGGGVKQISGGGSVSQTPAERNAALLTEATKIRDAVRSLLHDVQAGSLNPASLQALQAQLSTVPAGLQQLIGGAGIVAVGAPASGGGISQTSGAEKQVMEPGVAGRLSGDIPKDIAGKELRFGLLDDELKVRIARALGSKIGSRAMFPDARIQIQANGDVTLLDRTTVQLRNESRTIGGGPGVDTAHLIMPRRQPVSVGIMERAEVSSGVRGGGISTQGSNSANRITLFAPGQAIRSLDFGGITGNFTWNKLSAKARAAIKEWIAEHPGSAAAKALSSATGSGWSIAAGTKIRMEAGFATFIDPLILVRNGERVTINNNAPPPPPGTLGPAPQPPVGGGGGVAPTPPAGAGTTPAPTAGDANGPAGPPANNEPGGGEDVPPPANTPAIPRPQPAE